MSATHVGSYAGLAEANAKLHAWIESEGLEPAGGLWESYVDDPGAVPEAEVRTRSSGRSRARADDRLEPFRGSRGDRGAICLQAVIAGNADDLAPGPSGGIPNGSRSPWITSTGTSTASSSSMRLGTCFAGSRRGGRSGKARQRTPIAPVSAAVRQATRAPDERPPATSGSPRSCAPRRCSTTASQAASS